VQYFTKSNQALDLLKQRQKIIPLYADLKQPLTILQDVWTRWWSTWRMIRRLRFLRSAIDSLIGSREATCEDLSDEQWKVLEYVQKSLASPSEAQRILEGEKYVTSSLVPRSIHRIRKNYCSMIQDNNTPEPVKMLVKKLLEDLDKRWEPTPDGKVCFSEEIKRGKGNRYVHIHPFFFYAAFLDPRMKNDLKSIMTQMNYNQLKHSMLNEMVKVAKKEKDEANENERPPPQQQCQYASMCQHKREQSFHII